MSLDVRSTPAVNLDGLRDAIATYSSRGLCIWGEEIEPGRFRFNSDFNQLSKIVPDPMAATDPRNIDQFGNQEFAALHSEIQREFKGKRKQNVPSYCDNIIDFKNGKSGDTPEIALFSPDTLNVFRGEKPFLRDLLVIPFNTLVIAYDGETQTAARYMAAMKDRTTRDLPISCVITFGKPASYAARCFDYRNRYAVKAPVAVSINMESDDPITLATQAVNDVAPPGSIIWDGRQMPRKLGAAIAVGSYVHTGVLCLAHGLKGIQGAPKGLPDSISDEHFKYLVKLYFGKVIDNLGDFMRDREQYVTSSPAVWAALGTMGHDLLTSPEPESKADSILWRLRDVDWRKSDAWVGIAIKKTPTGYSFAGGAKDSASIVLRALADETSGDLYKKIRRSPVREKMSA